MKRYWPLLLLTLVIAAVVGMSQHYENAKQSCEDSARKAKAAWVTKNGDKEASKDADDACHSPVRARYFTWPEGVGAWAVVLTLIVIAWQSIATEKAAAATLLNAVALINSERPWLFSDHGIERTLSDEDRGESSYCDIRVVNRGKNYAQITSFCEPKIVVVPKGKHLPKEPEYGPSKEWYPHIFLDGGKSADITQIDEEQLGMLGKTNDDFERLRSGDDAAYVFGVVFYRDLLKRDELHELRWCLRVRPTDKGIHAFMSGPDRYNRVT